MTTRSDIEIGVNDVDLLAKRRIQQSISETDVAVTPPRRSQLAPWVPRFVYPSTLYPLTENPDRHALNHLLGRPLHTTANEVSDDLRLQFDRLGPDDVGTCLHEVIVRLVERDVPEDTVRRMDDEVVQILTETLHEHTQRLGEDERDRVVGFFREAIIDDLLESDLWTRLQTAETVQVEKPISGLVTVQDIQMELHGEADFVIQTPSGEQHVVDIKIALADPTNETQKRYQLQIAAYAYLFDQVSTSTDLVRPTVETFGVKRRTTVSEWTPEIVERRLAVLLKKTRNST